MTIELRDVLETDKVMLRNLYSLYLHELSAYTENLQINEEGIFHYEDLDDFWRVDGLSPYFIMWHEQIIGFTLLLERPFLKKQNDVGINDIFILNPYKGKGFAVQAVKKVFDEKPGRYFIIQLAANQRAVAFWKKAYTEFNIEIIERKEVVDEEICLIQTFTV